MTTIPIYEPSLEGNERKYLIDCIDTVWISSQGKYILDFEKLLASYHGMGFGIATSNCTTALHLAIKALGLGEGDEILCPDLTFIAPANMILLSGASLKLVDIDADTLAMNPELIEKSITTKTKAIIVVHQFGHAAPMDEIMDIAKRHNLKVIEDNAECIGGKYKGKLLGTFGDISCFSFFGNKIITSGEGGALLTNDPLLATTCKELRDHGMSSNEKYLHVALGYNYRMTNMQAAIGLAQLERVDDILALRKTQMDTYYDLLKTVQGIKLRPFAEWCSPVHWLTTITLDKKYDRKEVIKAMKEKGVECRPMINPVHHALYLKDNYSDDQFPVAVDIAARSIHLPSSNKISKTEIEYIVKSLQEVL
ncbi:MAG: DegT/DnrJ/EryC1/StrS family aminotransferase [Chitinophagaceae bacterium]|nr:MAG: DegT/DnrJ/EryC1/StrS family aminotransferase [Chitinophagaceae bacterium]